MFLNLFLLMTAKLEMNLKMMAVILTTLKKLNLGMKR